MVRGLVRFLNNSSLLVALAAAALTVESFIICGIPIRVWLVIEVFFITWCGYIFLRREEGAPYQKSLIYIAVTGSTICFFMTNFFGWQILVASGAIVLVYNLSTKKVQKVSHFIPRQITFLKPAAVGMAWALTTSLWPAYFASDKEAPYYLLALSNFFYITALAICDDIRDMNRDNGVIKTLPIVIGLKTTRIIIVLHLAIAVWLFSYTNEYHIKSISYAYIVCMAAITVLVLNIRPQGNWHIQALTIDGSIILRAIVIMLLAFMA